MSGSEMHAGVEVTVVIVGFNSGAHLPRCLESLEAQTVRNFEVILIDNASDAPPYADEAVPEIVTRYIRNDVNLGFAAASNQGARQGRGRWVAFLNPDAFPDPNWIAALMDESRRAPWIRSFTSLQVMADDPKRLDGAGDNYFFAGFPWRGGFDQVAPTDLRSGLVFSPCGAAAMLDRALFLSIGGFDEDFFCYCEDVDLGFRLLGLGHETLFVPDARVLHVGSASLGRINSTVIRWGARNRVWVLVKNIPTVLLPLVVPAHFCVLLFLLTRLLTLSDGAKLSCATLRGVREAANGLGKMLEKRQTVQSKRLVGWRKIATAMCWNPMLFHRRALFIRTPAERGGHWR